jgi:arylsulfatase A-like enzyme
MPSMMRGNDDIKEEGYATDLFRRESVKFVRENKSKPFFLYVPFNAPHSASNLEKDSYQAPKEFIDLYPEAKDSRAVNRTKYMAMVTCMDAAIGELLDTLRALGLERDTLVIFFSDNGGGGPADNHPLRGRKGDTWEGGIRVPFIARWPGKIPAGKVTDEFLSALELFPTFVSMAKAKSPKNVEMDGFNMLPVLQGKEKSQRSEMFWERRQFKAARVGNYKWVDMEKGGGLFDLSTDISEQHDLSFEKPEILNQLKSRYTSWKNKMDAAEPRGPFKNY